MDSLKIFVSHSHTDNPFCRKLVAALRNAGANPWFDESDIEYGIEVVRTIERELRTSSVFIVVLTPAALKSWWVAEESAWAYWLWRHHQIKRILPVTAAPLKNELSLWAFIHNFKRIEAPGLQPYPEDEAIRLTLQTLDLLKLEMESETSREECTTICLQPDHCANCYSA